MNAPLVTVTGPSSASFLLLEVVYLWTFAKVPFPIVSPASWWTCSDSEYGFSSETWMTGKNACYPQCCSFRGKTERNGGTEADGKP